MLKTYSNLTDRTYPRICGSSKDVERFEKSFVGISTINKIMHEADAALFQGDRKLKYKWENQKFQTYKYF